MSNVNSSKLKKLAIVMPIRFDTPLGAAKRHPNGYQNKRVTREIACEKRGLCASDLKSMLLRNVHVRVCVLNA